MTQQQRVTYPSQLLDFDAHLLQAFLGSLIPGPFLCPTLSATINFSVNFASYTPDWGCLRAFAGTIGINPLKGPISPLELLVEERKVAYGCWRSRKAELRW
jgi:hypothetical protein